MLPDRSVLIDQKLMENAKIEKFKCDTMSNFQTMFQQRNWGIFLRGTLQVYLGCDLEFNVVYRLAAGEKELSVQH